MRALAGTAAALCTLAVMAAVVVIFHITIEWPDDDSLGA